MKPDGGVPVEQLLTYLRAHRSEVSVARLSRESGISRSVLYRILRTRANVTVATMQAVLDALGTITGRRCRLLVMIDDIPS